MDDYALLQEYLNKNSERAFAELVKRHLPFVYSCALRLTRDPSAAEDITQLVFIQLARKAWMLRKTHAIQGWLYRATQRTFLMSRRQETRRRQREWEALLLADQNQDGSGHLDQIVPLLDEALRRLSRVEQDAILLHYFQGKAFHEVGAALGLNKSAAHKRVTRAVEKMRVHLARHGVTTTMAVLLTAAVSRQAAITTPVELMAKISTALGSDVGVAGGVFAGLGRVFYRLTHNYALQGAMVMAVVAAIPIFWQHQALTVLNRQVDELRAADGNLVPTSVQAVSGFRPTALSRLDRLRQLIEYASSLNIPQLQAVLNDMMQRSTSRATEEDIPIFIERFVELDPAAALAWAKTLPGSDLRDQILTTLFQAWTFVDPLAAFHATGEITQANLRADLQEYTVSYMEDASPREILAVLTNLPPIEQSATILGDFFRAWAMQDHVAAAEAVKNLPPTRNRFVAAENVVVGWAETDPLAALTWANENFDNLSGDAFDKAVGYYAQQDPQAAVRYVSSIASAAKRNRMMTIVAEKWGEQDPLSALAWVEEFADGQTRDLAIQGLVIRYSAIDPAAASLLLDKIPEGDLRDKAILSVGSHWKMHNLLAALDWIRSLPAIPASVNPIRDTLLINTMHAWANANPAEAAQYAQTMHDDRAYGRVIQAVATSWQNVDPKEAFAWAQTLPLDIGGRTARRNIITQYANRNPQDAWNYAQQLTGILREQTVLMVLAKWCSQNPAQACAALAKSNLGEDRLVTATASLAGIWCAQDPVAASKWVDTLPRGSARDKAVGQLIEIEGKNNPPAAFKWATTIGDKADRLEQMTLVISDWAKAKPAEAKAAVESVKLAADEQAVLLQLVQPDPAVVAH